MLSAVQADLDQTLQDVRKGAARERSASGKVVCLVLDEPSTRNRYSIEAAAHRLGVGIVLLGGGVPTSETKGESRRETFEVISQYVDAFAVRSAIPGLPRAVGVVAGRPVLNLGDGSNEHPSQAIATLAALLEWYDDLRGLSIVIWGDLARARTAHSLLLGAAQFGAAIALVAPPGAAMPARYVRVARALNEDAPVVEYESLSDVPGRHALLYLNRTQRERGGSRDGGQQAMLELEDCEPFDHVLHPLPVGDELAPEVHARFRPKFLEHVGRTYEVRRQLLLGMLVGGMTDDDRISSEGGAAHEACIYADPEWEDTGEVFLGQTGARFCAGCWHPLGS